MTKATFQTKVPINLTRFCETYGLLFGDVEKNLYRELQTDKKLKDLKREYQIQYGINARQFNSVHYSIKGKIASRKECHKRQINQLRSGIKELSKTIAKLEKRLRRTPLACSIKGAMSPRKLISWKLHQKKRKLAIKQSKLSQVQATPPSIIFGGKKLWKAQFNLEANDYSTDKDWLRDWQQQRCNQFMLVGSKDESLGNQNCQLTTEGELKIRVPKALQGQFGDDVYAEGIQFAYGQDDIDYALKKGTALTFRFVRKQDQCYIFVTCDRAEVPDQSHRRNGMMGVDLNPGVIGWAYCDSDGNLKKSGQIQFNLQDKSTQQTKAILGDAVKYLVDIAGIYECPITLERLDFGNKKSRMAESGVNYCRMLSNFAYSQFSTMLHSRGERFGIQVIDVNPAYSSTIGLTKFMRMYG